MGQRTYERRRIRFSTVFIPVLFCCALLLGGCSGSTASTPSKTPTTPPISTATLTPLPTTGATPTGSPSPTGTASSGTGGFSTFRSGDGSYTINFPSGWGTEPMTEQGVTAQLFGSTDRADVFAVLPISQTIVPAGYSTIIESFVAKNGFGGTNLLVFPVSTTTTLNGITWTRLTATFTLQTVPNSLIGYVTPQGSGTFALLFFAPDTTFAAVDTKDFEVMAQSLTFLTSPSPTATP